MVFQAPATVSLLQCSVQKFQNVILKIIFKLIIQNAHIARKRMCCLFPERRICRLLPDLFACSFQTIGEFALSRAENYFFKPEFGVFKSEKSWSFPRRGIISSSRSLTFPNRRRVVLVRSCSLESSFREVFCPCVSGALFIASSFASFFCLKYKIFLNSNWVKIGRREKIV